MRAATGFMPISLMVLGFFSAPVPSVGEPSPQFREKMQGLYRSLAELMTDVCSDERYQDPKNASRIEKEIQAIAGLSHDLSRKSSDLKKTDPTLPLIAGFLTQELAEAKRSFSGGQRDYARRILRSLPGYCIECHSRNPVGAEFARLPFEPTSPLRPAERGKFYAATRQFDRAIEELRPVIGGRVPGVGTYELEEAVRSVLTIAVRFKRSPALTRSLLNEALENKSIPRFLAQDLSNWLRLAADWEKEPTRRLVSEAGRYAEAQRLMALARKTQTYPMDHTADLLYLRATSVLYDQLAADPSGKRSADAFLLQGMCYEVLNPRRLETLHHLYYETCIRRAPHTPIARTCYHRYEASVFFGYTGSAGTDLPQDSRDRLLELWSIATEIKGKI